MDKQLLSLTAIVLMAVISLLSGLFVGLVAGSVTWVASGDWQGMALTTGSATALLMWVACLAWWFSTYEKIIGIRPQLPPITLEAQTTRITLMREQGNYTAGDYTDCSLPQSKIVIICNDILQSNNTSNLGGANKPYSRRDGEVFRDYLIANGLAEWRNPLSRNQGWVMTEDGMEFVRQFANTPPPAKMHTNAHGKTLKAVRTHAHTRLPDGWEEL